MDPSPISSVGSERNEKISRKNLVSVILPDAHRPETLSQSLASLTVQTFRDFEVIVINDGGEDVFSLLQQFRSTLTLHYIRHPAPRGRLVALNNGLRVAEGKYIAYLEEHDVFSPDHLGLLVRGLESSGKRVGLAKAIRDGNGCEGDDFFALSGLMHARSCLDDVGYFDEGSMKSADRDFWHRLSQKFESIHTEKITLEVRHSQSDAAVDSDSIEWSIILPVHNQAEATRSCLEILIENPPEGPFEVVIINDGSTDGTQEFLACLEGDVKIITNPQRRGAAKACNQGARMSVGKYLLFIENTIRFQPAWSETLLNKMEGGKSLEMESGFGPCLAVNKDLFSKMGGFDESCPEGWEKLKLYLKGKGKGDPEGILAYL